MVDVRPIIEDDADIVRAMLTDCMGLHEGRMARRDGARRLWLITTNHNTVALRFYQRLGFDLIALHRDGVTRARAELKPEIPLEVDGIPLRHELELEMRLD